MASFLPYLSRSKDRVGGAGGRSAPAYGRAGQRPATAVAAKPPPLPARASQKVETRQAPAWKKEKGLERVWLQTLLWWLPKLDSNQRPCD